MVYRFTSNQEGINRPEYILFILIYCFYIQYQNFCSETFKKYDTHLYSLQSYFRNKYINDKYSLKQFNKITYVFNSIYIWIIMILSFICITQFETNLLLSVKLLIFLLIFYQIIKFIYSRESGSILSCLLITFVFYSGISTLVIYFYQFFGVELIKTLLQDQLNSIPLYVRKIMDKVGLKVKNFNFSFI